MSVQRLELPEPVLGRHMKGTSGVFPGILAIVWPPPVVIDGGSEQVNQPSKVSDHRLEVTAWGWQAGPEGGPPKQLSGDLRKNLRRDVMAVAERPRICTAKASMGFGNFLASHLQEVEMLTRGNISTQQRLARVEVGLGLRAKARDQAYKDCFMDYHRQGSQPSAARTSPGSANRSAG